MSEPEYKVLLEKSLRYVRIANLAIEEELDEEAVENFNFALELLTKAVLEKEGIKTRKLITFWLYLIVEVLRV